VFDEVDRGIRRERLPANGIKGEITARVIGIRVGECKNCRIPLEETGLKHKCADKEIHEYPEEVTGNVLELSNWVRELV